MIEKKIETLIIENLNEILRCSNNNLNNVKNSIKYLTYLYLIESGYIYFNEDVKDVMNNVKYTFWSNTLGVWNGNITMANWVGGIGINLLSGNFGFGAIASSVLNEVFKRTVPEVMRIYTLRIAMISIFPTILLGLVLYSLISYKDVLKLRNFEITLKTCIEVIQLNTKEDFKETYNNLSKKYNDFLKNVCANIKDEKERLKVASNMYFIYLTENILVRLIKEYIKYLNDRKLNVSYMSTFLELCSYNLNPNQKMIIQFKQLYKSFNEAIDVYVFEESKRKSLKQLLDDTVKKSVTQISNKNV